eukprot:6214480-Karenia_brevis.AAC.1
MYDKLEHIRRDCLKKGCMFIVLGDFNASIGVRRDTEDHKILGNFGYGCRNPRGQWLVDWCLAEKMAVLNSQFKDQKGKRWTHRNDGTRHKQVCDYALINFNGLRSVLDCKVVDDVHMGSDHRALHLILKVHLKIHHRGNRIRRQK